MYTTPRPSELISYNTIGIRNIVALSCEKGLWNAWNREKLRISIIQWNETSKKNIAIKICPKRQIGIAIGILESYLTLNTAQSDQTRCSLFLSSTLIFLLQFLALIAWRVTRRKSVPTCFPQIVTTTRTYYDENSTCILEGRGKLSRTSTSYTVTVKQMNH